MGNKKYYILVIIILVLLILIVCCLMGAKLVTTLRAEGTTVYLQTSVAGTMVAKSLPLTQTAESLSKTAEPTRTPYPTSTSDTRSNFEKCNESGVGVRYIIMGKNVSGVSITLENDSGGSDQGEFGVPYCRTLTQFGSNDFLYISAQIINPTSGAGSIICEIWDGRSRIAKAEASGFASIATCSTLR
jgi:hypothetical protein